MHVEEGVLLSHFRVLERIGEGGMSVVWRALDTRLGREVAIKLLPEAFETDPARRGRLETEARAIASLNHPNIVTVHSIEEFDGCLFLAMELVRGKTLDTLIPPEGMPIETFFDLAVPLCDAVSAAHEHGVTHRDLKPRNIMVTDEGALKILDFGLAMTKGLPPGTPPEDAPTEETAFAGRLAGTLAYMAPEQLAGTAPNTRSDVFSLGVVLYQMAAGRLPFRGETAAEMIANIMRSEPPQLAELSREIPRHLSRLVHSCLEKNPERRLSSARELCEELRTIRRSPATAASDLRRSIAVLPFLDMSPDQDQRYFCEGIAEEILNALSRIDGLRVVSRTSSFRFKSADLDIREIGDRLGVGSLLEGGVRKAGDRIRITANLIDVGSGYELWSEKYDRELRDIFAIQDEISQSIVQALKGTLSPRERRVMKQVATSDVRAYDYYLRGRSYYYQFRRRGIQFALQMFSRAIEIDPSYALAYAGMADCSSFLYMNVERTEENRLEAEEASRRALDLDPELAEAHAARALALSNSGRHDEAEREFEEAEGQNPRLFEAFYYHARDSFARGEREKAIDLYRKAAEVRPEDYQAPLLMAQVYEDLGRHEKAREARGQGVRLAEERLDQNPDDIRALYMGANGLVALGEREQGLKWARRALEVEPDEPMLLYNVACIYSLAEEADAALQCLERAIDGGFAHRDWIRRDSNLDLVRADPRYAAILAKLRG
jgi:serine/threonine protein kinase/Tfp pilus assembly protein PilF